MKPNEDQFLVINFQGCYHFYLLILRTEEAIFLIGFFCAISSSHCGTALGYQLCATKGPYQTSHLVGMGGARFLLHLHAETKQEIMASVETLSGKPTMHTYLLDFLLSIFFIFNFFGFFLCYFRSAFTKIIWSYFIKFLNIFQ